MLDKFRQIKKWTSLAIRVLTLIAVGVYYLVKNVIGGESFSYTTPLIVLLLLVWAEFVVDTILKLVANRHIPMGAKKHKKANYLPTGAEIVQKHDWKKTFIMAVLWGVAIVVFGLGKFLGFFDEGLLILGFLALCVWDSLSVHFYCPFRVFVMKNKCCTTCRIYNWDGLMIATPLYFVHNVFTFILIGLNLILFIWWEVAYKVHPERFSESTNANLKCSNCTNSNCPRKNK